MIVLGQMVAGVEVAQLKVGMPVELVLEPLYAMATRTSWCGSGSRSRRAHEPRGRSPRRRHASLGQVGTQLRRVRRARGARRAQGCGRALERRAVRFRCRHHALRLPRLRGRAPPSRRRSAGRARRSTPPTPPAPPVRRRSPRRARRSSPGRATWRSWWARTPRPKGFLAPMAGYRPEDPDWVRFHLGITNPTYFALYARRRMDLYGATVEDFTAVKVKNAAHGAANPECPLPQALHARGSARVGDGGGPAAPAARVRNLRRRRGGGAERALSTRAGAAARRRGSPRSQRSRRALRATRSRCPTSPRIPPPRPRGTRSAPPSRARAYEEAGVGTEGSVAGGGLRPRRLDGAGLVRVPGPVRAGRRGGAAAQRCHRDRRPHPGECQRRPCVLRRGGTRAGAGAGVRARMAAARRRPANGRSQNARVGITANQGLFGHGSSVIVKA